MCQLSTSHANQRFIDEMNSLGIPMQRSNNLPNIRSGLTPWQIVRIGRVMGTYSTTLVVILHNSGHTEYDNEAVVAMLVRLDEAVDMV